MAPSTSVGHGSDEMSMDSLSSSPALMRLSSARRRAHRNSLRALRAVTNLCQTNSGLSSLVNTHFDRENTPPDGSDEQKWLNANDLSNGRYFDEASLPFPTFAHHEPSIYTSKPNSKSSLASQISHGPSGLDVAASAEPTSASLDPIVSTQPSLKHLSDSEAIVGLPDTPKDAVMSTDAAQKGLLPPDGPSAPPVSVAPPEPEEEAQLSGSTQLLLDRQTPEKPARVVHLPSLEVQEERRREVEEEQRKRAIEEQAKPARPASSHLHAEQVSSPSSTVGAHSTNTPLPPQDSPDTSPDSDVAEASQTKEILPSPEARRQKEEHDRLLEAQKEIARKNALGDVSSADDQLRWEEREAVAREAEEKAAREAVNGPESTAEFVAESTQAAQAVRDVANADAMEVDGAAQDRQNMKPDPPTVPIVPTDNGPAKPILPSNDATPSTFNKTSLTVDTSTSTRAVVNMSRAVTPPAAPSARPTPATNNSLHKRAFSEMVRGSHSSATKTDVAPYLAGHGLSLQTSPRATQFSAPSTPDDPIVALKRLKTLKGAASDPDRDYLEPLFRIQAHDLPNINTTPLHDLIRSASKAVTTADHYAMIEERADHKILRRIYQLQNANKWSLRQMEKAKEPDQPMTHHDHMMAEMRWMRKDFKAERKMKKSVCAWLARRCADYYAADAESKKAMQVRVKVAPSRDVDPLAEPVPELESPGDSAPEDDIAPPTPDGESLMPLNLTVPPELSATVAELKRSGKLGAALQRLPVVGFHDAASKPNALPALTAVAKYIDGKVLPRASSTAVLKRSRFDYSDDNEVTDEGPRTKRLRSRRGLPADDEEIALFHPENKQLRDRLHANTAFRPPSEFVMPSTSFYEFRNGSQWIWEDDQKLRMLAKDYSFNWSLIADELTLSPVTKSSAERRTPWECFERWVELEQLPAEMKKTVYFKTWFQRLEQSQQAADRRYQNTVAALQAQNSAQAAHIPPRRRTVPTRVDKRKSTRYLWLVDAMRKLARKKEQQAYKQAESQRAAAQRKTQVDTNQPRGPKLTPQEFSRKRHERDMQILEAQRQHRQKMLEQHQQRQLMMVRHAQAQMQQQTQQQQQQGAPNLANQQRHAGQPSMQAQQAQMAANAQQAQNANVQMQQQGRPPMPMATRNGHLAVPQVGAQGIPQAAQMRGNGQMPNSQDMQRMAQANAQARHAQFNQAFAQMPNGNMASPGAQMTTQQQLQNNQALLVAMQQQQAQQQAQQQQQHQQSHQQSHQQQQQQQHTPQANQMHSVQQNGGHQMSASPRMPPPPTPQGHPQSLSSGRVPTILKLQSDIRAQYPQATEEQVQAMATKMLREQSVSTSQVRQNAMNAAAGINGVAVPNTGSSMAYGNNQAAYQANQQQVVGNTQAYMKNDGSAVASPQQQQQQQQQPQGTNQAQYAALLRQRQMQQMRLQQAQQQQQQAQQHAAQHSPVAHQAQLNMQQQVVGSPSVAHASPNLAPTSPAVQFANMNHGTPNMVAAGVLPHHSPSQHQQQQPQQSQQGQQQGQQTQSQQQRPPSRSNTPQMQRLGSSGSVAANIQSPNATTMQGSPHMQANMAR